MQSLCHVSDKAVLTGSLLAGYEIRCRGLAMTRTRLGCSQELQPRLAAPPAGHQSAAQQGGGGEGEADQGEGEQQQGGQHRQQPDRGDSFPRLDGTIQIR